MIYKVLGELEISHGGRLIKLPGGHTLIMLAALLINPNRRISKVELIRAAWGEDEVEEAQLYKRIKVVRDLLAEIGRGTDLRTHARFGYEVRVAEEDIDVLLFQRMVRDADEALVERRVDDEIDCLRRSLRLWRGAHPLSNVPTDVFYQECVALEQRHKRVAVRLFDLELARGNHERILDELILISSFYPSDRRLCEQLMTAEYRCGHLAEVARTYERYRETFAEETGSEPDPLLRNFHFAVALGDESAITAAWAAIARRAGTSYRPALAVPRQLPPAADLVGRAEATAEASRLLRQASRQAASVVVISGPGGIGKTALALRTAHATSDRYPDGQLYMELHGTKASTIDTSEILAQFLRALGVARVPETKPERLSVYRTLLADRRVLVMLDDAADGAQVSELVPANPQCAVLVTARHRLPEISGAHHIAPLGPLGQADAVELFCGTARSAGVDVTDDPAAVARVVQLCGGLPLALRIAAALRVRDHPRPTAELADRLTRQGPAGFVYGDLSVARTIGAGFERLDAGARELFLTLGLLPFTEFGLWTAAAVLDQPGADSGTALSQLTARFMVESVESRGRYHFHDLTREYARRRAQAEVPGSRDEICGQVYRALLTLTRRAHARLYGGDFEVVHSPVPDWEAPAEVLAEVDTAPLGWFEKERSNIRAAVEHCAELGLDEVSWDLAVSSHEFYTIRGYFDDWHATHTVALDASRRAGDTLGEAIVIACLNQPALAASRRASSTAVPALRRAAGLMDECGNRHGQAIVLRTLANTLRRQGHLTQPVELFNRAFAWYAECADTVGQWQALRYIGQVHLDRGDHGQARLVLEQAALLADRLAEGRLVAQTRYWIGQACLAAGDLDGARQAFTAVLTVYGDAMGAGRAYAIHGMGEMAWRNGAYEAAERKFAEAAGLSRDAADAVLEGRVWLSAAALYRDQAREDDQVVALERAVAAFEGCGATYLEVRALAGLAGVLARRGEAAAADAAWTRVGILYGSSSVPLQDRLFTGPGR